MQRNARPGMRIENSGITFTEKLNIKDKLEAVVILESCLSVDSVHGVDILFSALIKLLEDQNGRD